jgi:23S rRNA (guanosine2251-2'-O)-methyltransferase
MFRTADAAGISKIFLTGYTPTPIDRFQLPRKDFAKVSLGAENTIPWVYAKTLASVIKKLKSEGYTIAAIEQDKSSVSLFDWKPVDTEKLALVLGNEVLGISKPSLKQCDVILEIPMRGKKESLNVSVAAGIAIYYVLQSSV